MRQRIIGDGGSTSTDDSGGDPSTDDSDPSIGGGDYDPSPLGSGEVVTSVDPDTGRAQQRIEGAAGSSTPTGDATGDNDNVDVARTQPGDAGGDPSLEGTEQAVEDATGGRAYGDPSTTEDVGSGAAVTTVPDNDNAQNQRATSDDGLDGAGVATVAVLGLAGLAALGGGA